MAWSPCPTPRKTWYRDERHALAALRLIQGQPIRSGPLPIRAYRCPCGRWHLTAMVLSTSAVTLGE